jgi:hypothetical protein
MWTKYQIRRTGGCLRHDSGKIAARVFSGETLAPHSVRVGNRFASGKRGQIRNLEPRFDSIEAENPLKALVRRFWLSPDRQTRYESAV